tara:strand:- start:10918 stop:12876 length:1959 start_codon:yes stop_codon:yes gene_type:complete
MVFVEAERSKRAGGRLVHLRGILCLCLCLVLSWLSLGKTTHASVGSGMFEMRGPKSMLLGKDASATISVKVGDRKVRLHASVGTLSGETVSKGTLSATYTPPTTRFPQFAIIVATTDDLSIVEFITIPLLGQPTIRVASEPRAVVYVGVDGATFGPLNLNRRGRGKIRLIVPPGVAEATVHSSDRLGNETTEPYDLGVPPFQQLVALCPKGSDELVVVAIDGKGRAESSGSLTLNAEIGVLAPPGMRSPGIYSARYEVRDDVAPETTSELSATMKGAGAVVRCQALVPREAPISLAVSTNRPDFVAGSNAPIEVQVKFSYPRKRAPRHVLPTIFAQMGTFSEPELIGKNTYRIAWALPDAFDGNTEATMRIGVVGDALEQQVQVQLVAGELSRIALGASKATMTANRNEGASVRVSSFDRYENPVPSNTVRLSAEKGGLEAVEQDEEGLHARYRTPLRYATTKDTITARSDSGVKTSISVLLAPAPRCLLAHARVGYSTNLGRVSALAFAADAAYRFPLGEQGLLLGVESGYFLSTTSEPRSDEVEDVSMRIAVIPLMARAVYEVNTLPIQLYGGGGAGVLFARASLESPRSGMRVENAPVFAFSTVLGARQPVGIGVLVLEAAYWHGDFDEAGLAGNIGGLRITGGYGFEL